MNLLELWMIKTARWGTCATGSPATLELPCSSSFTPHTFFSPVFHICCSFCWNNPFPKHIDSPSSYSERPSTDHLTQSSALLPLHTPTHAHTHVHAHTQSSSCPILFFVALITTWNYIFFCIFALSLSLSTKPQKRNICWFVHYCLPSAGYVQCSINTCWVNKLIYACETNRFFWFWFLFLGFLRQGLPR